MIEVLMMKLSINSNNTFQVDLDAPLDISIPIRSGDENPNCYHSSHPLFTPIESDSFIGSVSKGGACNHQLLSLSPHGNGTHTECYGHLSPDPEITINKCLKQFHFLAILISVSPEKTEDGDLVIRWERIASKLDNYAKALIIRTLPNSPEKTFKNYSGTNPPYLDRKVALGAAKKGISHLLVDLPSVDKEEDHGNLLVHRDFWNYPKSPRKSSTITELLYIPDTIPDGRYLLNLQIVSLESDASPSKPVLYPLYPEIPNKY